MDTLEKVDVSVRPITEWEIAPLIVAPEAKPKLSHLMRVGSEGRRQTGGHFWDSTGAVCAVGAAYIGLTGGPCEPLKLGYVWDTLAAACGLSADRLVLPPDGYIICNCPSCLRRKEAHKGENLSNVITGLNDDAHWSIPAIADWLESIGY